MAVAYAIGAKDKGATCRICGQPALPVLRLCAQCKAALKRVRHDTVSQQMPMPRRPRGGERYRAALGRADADGVRRSGMGAWRGVRVPLALTAMLAIVGSAGYFIVQQIHAAMPPEVNAATRTDADRVSVSQTIPPAAPRLPESQAPSPATSSISTAEEPAAPTIKPKPVARVVKPVAAPIVAPTPEVRPEPAPVPVVVAAAPPPPAVRPPDRMQLLSQAIAQCPADGVLARMVCEQKARVQYCDGYWGQTSLCPNGAPDRSLSH